MALRGRGLNPYFWASIALLGLAVLIASGPATAAWIAAVVADIYEGGF